MGLRLSCVKGDGFACPGGIPQLARPEVQACAAWDTATARSPLTPTPTDAGWLHRVHAHPSSRMEKRQ